MNSQIRTNTLTNTTIINTTLPTSSVTSEENQFLRNLAQTYHVNNIPLAIFLLIISCIFAILLAVLLIYLVRWCLRRYFVGRAKSRRKKPRAIYTDEIPGLSVQPHTSRSSPWLQYSIEYKLKQQQLVVAIIQCHNLTTQSEKVKSAFYVTLNCEHVDENTGRLKLLDRSHKTKSAELSSGIASWNEVFAFQIPEKELSNVRLSFQIYEVNPDGTDYDHGQMNATLRDEDMSEYVGSILEKTGKFGNVIAFQSHYGELCLGMAYYPREEKLDVHILEATSLILPQKLKTDERGYIYITVSLKSGNKVLKKFETSKRKNVESPYFNQKFSFKLKDEHLANAYVYCSVKYRTGWANKHRLGHVWIGSNSKQNSGVKQWEETIKNPSKVHIFWHSVLMSEH